MRRLRDVDRIGLLAVNCTFSIFFFFQAEDGIRDYKVTGVQTCALPIYPDRKPSTMKLYYSPGACSLSPHIVLHEAGLAYEPVLASTKTHKLQDGTDYYGINPLWHNTLYATKNNGFDGTDAKLVFNSPLHVKHFENLAKAAKDGSFVYKGRGNVPDAAFASGECAMITGSSGLYARVVKEGKFAFGQSQLPYYADVKIGR